MDLRHLITLLRRWFPLAIVTVVVGAGVGYVISSLTPTTYEARATLIVGQSLSGASPDYNQLLVSQRLSSTYASVATKRPNLEVVIEKLSLDETPDQLERAVRAEAPLDSTLLTISVQHHDPERAAAIANALAAQLLTVSPAIEGRRADIQASTDSDLRATQRQIEAASAKVETLASNPDRTPVEDARLETLEERLVTLRSTYATLLSFSSGQASNLLTVVEPAVPPTAPISPRVFLNVLLGAILGLFAAGLFIVMKEHLDDTIRTPAEAEQTVGHGTLGVIRRMSGSKGRAEMYRLVTVLYPRSAAAESYRTLRANVEFSSVDDKVSILLVTSSIPGEGKTVTACNLAVVFAQAGLKVLLVDSDLRKPGVHGVFNLQNAHGLTTLLRRDDVSLDSITQGTEQDNLRVLTSGPLPPNPAELLGSKRMLAVLERLKSVADLVVLDSPPVQSATDSAILSSLADGTLLVIGGGTCRRDSLLQARHSLDRAGARILGVVLNLIRDPARVGAEGTYGSYGGREEAAGPRSAVPTESLTR